MAITIQDLLDEEINKYPEDERAAFMAGVQFVIAFIDTLDVGL